MHKRQIIAAIFLCHVCAASAVCELRGLVVTQDGGRAVIHDLELTSGD